MRNQTFDVAKGIGIILVLVGHSVAYQDNGLLKYIYAFHMPMFFLISGLFYKAKPVSEGASSGWHRLIIPYFIVGFACAIPSILFGNTTSLAQLAQQAAGTLYSIPKRDWTFLCTPIWFLTCLFCTEVIYALCSKIKDGAKEIAIFSIFLSGIAIAKYINFYYPWNIQTAAVAVLFYHFGVLTAKSGFFDISASKYKHAALLVVSTLIFIASATAAPGRIDMSAGVYGDVFFLMATSLSGSAMVLSLSSLLRWASPLSLIGRNTIILFGFNYWVLWFGNLIALEKHGWLASFAVQIPFYIALVAISEKSELVSRLLKRKPPKPDSQSQKAAA